MCSASRCGTSLDGRFPEGLPRERIHNQPFDARYPLRMKVPTTYDLKPAFQRLLMPLLTRLRNAGVTPNALTWIAVVLSGGLGYAFVLGLENRYWFCGGRRVVGADGFECAG